MPDDDGSFLLRARDFTDPDAFAAETQRLGETTWQLLGCAADIPNDGDWVVGRLAGRSIFLQRVGTRVVAFENICPHRFYPLRTEARGHGAIECGLHHWVFAEDGTLASIPGCAAADLPGAEAKLMPIDIARCGDMVFGRLSVADGYTGSKSLVGYLGRLYPALSRIGTGLTLVAHVERTTAANWKFCYHMTLDDYHIVALHADTFGADGHLKDGTWRYYPFGDHNVMFVGPPPVGHETMMAFLQGCVQGQYDPVGYKIFNLFPNVIVVSLWFEGRLFFVVGLYAPLAVDRTLQYFWVYGDADTIALTNAKGQTVGQFWRQILEEDSTAAEYFHRTARDTAALPMRQDRSATLGLREVRTAWFHRVLDRLHDRTPA